MKPFLVNKLIISVIGVSVWNSVTYQLLISKYNHDKDYFDNGFPIVGNSFVIPIVNTNKKK